MLKENKWLELAKLTKSKIYFVEPQPDGSEKFMIDDDEYFIPIFIKDEEGKTAIDPSEVLLNFAKLISGKK